MPERPSRRSLARDPNVARLSSTPRAGLGMLVGSLVVAALIGALSFHVGRDYLRRRKLARSGRVLEGRLVSCEPAPFRGGEDEFWVTVFYEVASASGQVVHGKHTGRADRLQNEPFPEAGTPLAVLWCDERVHTLL